MDDFMPPEVDLHERSWVDSALASQGHRHILDLISRESELTFAHTLLHAAQASDTPEHEECLRQLAQLDKDKVRAWKAIYN